MVEGDLYGKQVVYESWWSGEVSYGMTTSNKCKTSLVTEGAKWVAADQCGQRHQNVYEQHAWGGCSCEKGRPLVRSRLKQA